MFYPLAAILLGAITIVADDLLTDELDLDTLYPNILGACAPNLCELPPLSYNEDQFAPIVAYMNEVFAYYAIASAGNRIMVLMVDTGSDETWINDLSSNVNDVGLKECEWLRNTIYNGIAQNREALYKTGGGIKPFHVDYLDKKHVDGALALADIQVLSGFVRHPAGDLWRDRVLKIQRQAVGVARSSEQCLGIMGVASYLQSDDEIDGLGDLAKNLSVVRNLRKGKQISTEAYSIYPLPERGGSILFGAVDDKKFEGDLVSLPMVRTQPLRPAITITNIVSNKKHWPSSVQIDGFSSVGLGNIAFLDTGSVLTYLRPNDVKRLYDAYDGESRIHLKGGGKDDYRQVPCEWRDSPRYVRFTFSTVTIEVSSQELILEIPDRDSKGRMCILGVASTLWSENRIILGYTFLRSAYAVVHLTKQEIFLAQSRPNATKSNIRSISDSYIPFTGQDRDESDSIEVQIHTLEERDTLPRGGRPGIGSAPTDSSHKSKRDRLDHQTITTTEASTATSTVQRGKVSATGAATFVCPVSSLGMWSLVVAVVLLLEL